MVKLNFNKKGVDMIKPIASLIIASLVIIILLVFVKKVGDVAIDTTGNVECKASVLAHQKTSQPINCPTDFVDIDASDVNKIKQQLSDLQIRCWNNYGKGEIPLFGNEEETFCALCSVVSITDYKEKIPGLQYYMATNSFKQGTEYHNYFEYLFQKSISSEQLDALYAVQEDNFIDPSQKYGVIFKYGKNLDWTKTEAVSVTGIATATAGVIAATTLFVGSAILTGTTMGAGTPVLIIATGVLSGSVAALSASLVYDELPPGYLDSTNNAALIVTPLNAESLKGIECTNLPVSFEE